MEKKLFHNRMEVASKERQQEALNNRLLWKENDELRKWNMKFLDHTAQGLTRNEFDEAFAAHYDLLSKATRDLQYEVEGYTYHRKEIADQTNELKARILELELEGPEPEPDSRIDELEKKISDLVYEKGNMEIELEVARNPASHEDSESRRAIQNRVLKEKDMRIVELEAMLGIEGRSRVEHDRRYRDNRGPEENAVIAFAETQEYEGSSSLLEASWLGGRP